MSRSVNSFRTKTVIAALTFIKSKTIKKGKSTMNRFAANTYVLMSLLSILFVLSLLCLSRALGYDFLPALFRTGPDYGLYVF